MTRKITNIGNNFDEFENKKLEKELRSAQNRIQELESSQVALNSQEVPLEQIEVNPNQPRKSFYDIKIMESLLASQGQKEPIILVDQGNTYMIFDGERRFRAAQNLKWQTLKACFIPYDPETFDRDVAIAALNKSTINSLDEAECLVKLLSLDLEPTEIANMLSATVSYLRRRDTLKYLSQLSEDYRELDNIRDKIGFRNQTESQICLGIIALGRSPISVAKNKFPLLKLADDLKQAIREKGLNDKIALSLNRISSLSPRLKDKIDSSEALKIRQELLETIYKEQLSIRNARICCDRRLNQLLGIETRKSQNRILNSLDSLKIAELSEAEKNELRERVENILAELRNYT